MVVRLMTVLAILLVVSTAQASSIFVKEGRAVYYSDKVFLEDSQLLKKPILVQYFGENSVSVIVADQLSITENDISIPKGEQFILDYNGKISQRLKFTNTTLDNTLGIEIPGTFIEGGKAMVKFEGIFSALLIEEGENGRRKVTLAQKHEFDETTNELHLYDGYSLLLDKDNALEEQVSFRELAFGGTLKCQIDAATSFAKNTPPSNMYDPYAIQNPGTSAPFNPKPVLLEYEVPKLKKVGVVPFKDQGEITGYADLVSEFFSTELGSDVEIVVLDMPEEEQSGIYLFDRAVRLGKEYGVDGIIQGRVKRLEVIGSETQQHFVKDYKLSGEVEASLVDTINGKYLWKNVAKVKDFTNGADYEKSKKSVLTELLRKAIKSLADDIKDKKALEGGTQR